MIGFEAKSSSNQPRMFGIVKKMMVNFDPNLLLSSPDATHDIAAPKGIIATASDKFSSVTSKLLLGEVSLGPDCALHPSDMPYMKEPPLAEMKEVVTIKT